MAVTPEFLAQEIEKTKDTSAVNIGAIFDEHILPKEGELDQSFQARKEALIAQTMMLIKEKKEGIQKYTRYLAIRAQLQIEKNNGVDVMHKDFQKIDRECLFNMDQISTEYPDIAAQISPQAIEKARQDFVRSLAVPIGILRQYDNIRKADFALTNKIQDPSLSSQKTDEAIGEQKKLLESKQQLEKAWPEIRYRVLLDQARGTPITATGSSSLSIAGFFSSVGNRVRQFLSAEPAPAEKPQAKAQSHTSRSPAGGDYLFNVLLLGDSAVGKSSLLQRFVDGVYIESSTATIGVDFKVKTIPSNESHVELQIWDTAGGQERFGEIGNVQGGAHAIIVFFDVTDRKSFQNVVQYLGKIDTFANSNVIVILAATKCDVPETEWAVSKAEIQAFAETKKKNVFFTSAKDDLNVEQLFEGAANSVIQNRPQSAPRPSF